MEWVLVAVVLTEAPNFTQSHSYYIPTFASQKLCDEALANMQGEFGKADGERRQDYGPGDLFPAEVVAIPCTHR